MKSRGCFGIASLYLFCVNLALLTVALFSSSALPATPPIAWTPTSIAETLAAGQTKAVSVSFTSLEYIDNGVVRVVPELEPFLQITPVMLGRINKGQTVNLDVSIIIASGLPPGSFDGTIQLRSGDYPKKIYAKPLPVTITIAGAIIGPEGGIVSGINGESITVPPGAFESNTPVKVDLLSAAEVPPLPEVNLLLLVIVNVGIGAELSEFSILEIAPPNFPLELSVPVGSDPFGSGAGVLAQVVTINGEVVLQAIDTVSIQNGIATTQQPAFPGILFSGLYCIYGAPSGIVTGTVSSEDSW